ncbi:MAG: Ig-like domain-containing protein, partial [Gemmatales bacterium]|nr:Ig-like domain-containing protein [Gemmatales bacterium]MDW8174989.1 Ig-like domain-containing protein [Gemmatales bacterium]
SFTFTWTDGLSPGNPATVWINVYNNAPVASDAYYTILHDTELTGQLYGYDPDGDAITAQLVSGPSHGSLTFDANGTFTYTPNQRFVGSDSFTFTWTDGLSPGDTATVWINVYNNAPVASDAYYTILHDTELTGHVYGYDPDGDPMTCQLLRLPLHGRLSLNADGSFTYLPDEGYVGQDSFEYAWHDGLILGSPALVTIHVENQAPTVTLHEAHRIAEGETIVLQGYDFVADGDGDRLSFHISSYPEYGRLELRGSELVYRAPESFRGTVVFTVLASDGVANVEFDVTINVDSQPPLGVPDHYVIDRRNYSPNGNHYELAGEVGATSNDYVSGNRQLQVELRDTSPGLSTRLVLASNGGISYRPPEDALTEEWFTYRASDGFGSTQDTMVRLFLHKGVQAMPDLIELSALPQTDEGWYMVAPTAGLLRNDYVSDDSLIVALELLDADPAIYQLVWELGESGQVTGVGLIIRAHHPSEVIDSQVRYRIRYQNASDQDIYSTEADVFLTDSIKEWLKRQALEQGDTVIDLFEAAGRAVAWYMMGETGEALCEIPSLFAKLAYDRTYMKPLEKFAYDKLKEIAVKNYWRLHSISDHPNEQRPVKEVHHVVDDKAAMRDLFGININAEAQHLKDSIERLIRQRFPNRRVEVRACDLKFYLFLMRTNRGGTVPGTGKGVQVHVRPIMEVTIAVDNTILTLSEWGPVYGTHIDGAFDQAVDIGHDVIRTHEYKIAHAYRVFTSALKRQGRQP